MKRLVWLRGTLAASGLCTWCSLALAQGTLPPVEVTAPRTTQSTDFTPPQNPLPNPPPQTPSYLTPTTGGSPFTYEGSPWGQFNYITPTIGGAPGDMFNSPRAYTTLDQNRINERIAGSTPELLQGIPGVIIQRTNMGGGSLIIRGRNGNQNLIMIDGIPMNDASWRFANVQYLNTIDEGVIERIEVIRGPESVLYGSGALGGVLNIVTKSRKNFQQNMDLDGNLITRYGTALEDPYNRVEISGNFLNMGVQSGASYLNVSQLHAGEGADFPSNSVAYAQRAADVRVDWLMNDGWTFTLAYQTLTQPFVPRTDRFPTPLVDPTRFTNRPTFTVPQTRDWGYARWAFHDDSPGWINGLAATVCLQQRLEGEIEFRPGAALQTTKIFDRDLNNFLDLRGYTYLTARNTLVYGTTYIQDWVYSSRWRQTGTAPVRYITPTLPPDGRYDQYGLFVSDRQEIGERLILNGGLRYSSIGAKGTAGIGTASVNRFDRNFQNWSGELGSVYAVTDSFHLTGSISQGFRAPNLEDLGSEDRATGQGPDFGVSSLEPEVATVYETGCKFRGQIFQGGATWYYSDNSTQIVRTPRAGGGNIRANTEGYIRGFELEGAVLLTDKFSLFYTGSHTYGQDETLSQPLSRINPAFIVLGTRWADRGPRIGMFIEGWTEMMGKQTRLSAADLTDNRIPIGGQPGWQTFNLRGGLDCHEYGQLTLGLFNIFDQNYRILGSGVDAPGIDFRVGYQLSF